jgi:UDP-glucose 4-epimerase
MKRRQWLITGGCGFIGRNLVACLLQQSDDTIRVFDNESTATRGDLETTCMRQAAAACPDGVAASSRIDFVHADIKDMSALVQAARGCDVCVHLAANTGVPQSIDDPVHDCVVNVQGTLHCLEAARRQGVAHVVLASSGAAVGECAPPIHEEVVAHPVSPYGASKLAGEGYASVYWRLHGVRTAALRFGNVYGPGSGHKTSVVAKFITQALRGETATVYGDGTQTRDFIYIDDLTRAICAASNLEQGGEVFQIATSREHTVNEVAGLIKSRLTHHGISMQLLHGDARPGDVARNFSDTTKAARILNWQNRTDLRDGIARTVTWFVQHTDTLHPPRA